MKRKNFAFRYEWSMAIAHLTPEYRLEILEATVRYAETGDTGPMTDIAAEAFHTLILPDFERRRKAADYRARAKARKAQKASTENVQPEPKTTASPEPALPAEEPRIIEAPAGPNRRERRLLKAEEKRLQKKRRRKTAHRAQHDTDRDTTHPLPRTHTPFRL